MTSKQIKQSTLSKVLFFMLTSSDVVMSISWERMLLKFAHVTNRKQPRTRDTYHVISTCMFLSVKQVDSLTERLGWC